MIRNNLRVERKASQGVMATKAELEQAISDAKDGAPFDYNQEVPVLLKQTATSAEAAGRLACNNQSCQLTCVGQDLTRAETPKSNIDGELVARCTATDCTDEGLGAAMLHFLDVVPTTVS